MKKGLLLINLGTPEAPERSAVRAFLREFLADPKVIDLPAPLRYLLLYGIILPFRTANTTKAYQSIWTGEGSPLLVNSMKLCQKLQNATGNDVQTALGMRYGKPSIASALKHLENCEQITVIPLYPQYSSTVTGSSIDHTMQLLQRRPSLASLHIIKDFFNNPLYIRAQAEQIKPYLADTQALLLSYHGLPERQLLKAGCKTICKLACNELSNSECYRAQCFTSTRMIAKALELPDDKVLTTFQSRIGKASWIQPYTFHTMEMLAKQGIKRIAIACPGFVADCLETLEEIGIRARQQWLQAGGEHLTLIPCLNDSDLFVETLVELFAH